MIPTTTERITELTEKLNTMLKCLASMKCNGHDESTDGRWVLYAHDLAELTGLPNKPLRPVRDHWTIDAELVALERIRSWLTAPQEYAREMTRAELAKLFNCSERTLVRRQKAGKLRVLDPANKLWRVHVDDLPK